MNFQQLVSLAEASAANQGYDVAKLPVRTGDGVSIEQVTVRPVKTDGDRAVWAVVVS